MIFINKSNPPKELENYKKNKEADYDSFRGEPKIAVKQSLLKEQGFLCAYCMKKINEDTIRIEHWLPQADPDIGKKLALDYYNMFGVCEGIIRNDENHCEKIRGTKKLEVKPTDIKTMEKIKYTPNGLIYSSDENINGDLAETLKLNIQTLKENRKKKREAIIEILDIKFKGKVWSEALIKKELSNLKEKSNQGELTEYCGVAIYFLEKKLKKL